MSTKPKFAIQGGLLQDPLGISKNKNALRKGLGERQWHEG